MKSYLERFTDAAFESYPYNLTPSEQDAMTRACLGEVLTNWPRLEMHGRTPEAEGRAFGQAIHARTRSRELLAELLQMAGPRAWP
jgi:hypothetical protein